MVVNDGDPPVVESVKNHPKKTKSGDSSKISMLCPINPIFQKYSTYLLKKVQHRVKTNILKLKLNTWRFGSDVFSFPFRGDG